MSPELVALLVSVAAVVVVAAVNAWRAWRGFDPIDVDPWSTFPHPDGCRCRSCQERTP